MVVNAEKNATQLPTAVALKEKLAMVEARKASDEARAHAAEAAEKKKLIDKLMEPSGVSDEEATKRVAGIIERAVANGLREVQVYRFPNQLCSDRGRAISQGEPGWETTLSGVPKEIFAFWNRALKPLGYKLRFEVVDWPGGMPGDIGVTLRWA